VFNGFSNDSYIIEYQRRDDCPAHYTMPSVEEWDRSVAQISAGEALELVKETVSPEAVVEFEREICTGLYCPSCDETEEVFRSLGKISEAEGRCPHCGELRDPQLTHAIYGDETYLDKTLAEIGLPAYDIITGREGMNMQHFLLAADRREALGCLA